MVSDNTTSNTKREQVILELQDTMIIKGIKSQPFYATHYRFGIPGIFALGKFADEPVSSKEHYYFFPYATMYPAEIDAVVLPSEKKEPSVG
jgi:hypothetical protein